MAQGELFAKKSVTNPINQAAVFKNYVLKIRLKTLCSIFPTEKCAALKIIIPSVGSKNNSKSSGFYLVACLVFI